MGKGKILRLHPFSARSPKYLFIPKHARFQVCFFSSPKFSHTIRRKKIASGILTLEALSRLGRVEREPQKPMGGGGATAPTIHLLVGGWVVVLWGWLDSHTEVSNTLVQP